MNRAPRSWRRATTRLDRRSSLSPAMDSSAEPGSSQRRRYALAGKAPALRTRLTYPVIGLWPAQLGLRRADHIFCLNSDDRDYLIQTGERPAASVTRIYPGADPVYAAAAEGRDYTRCERLLFAATWRKNKGVEDLVPAFLELARSHATLRLVVVGAGVPESVVRSHFPDSLQGRIACLSPTDEWSMAQAFADADVFLLPSLFEGTPLTLVQAMMSGLPIVTTNTCGMKDVIADGVNGLSGSHPLPRCDRVGSHAAHG